MTLSAATAAAALAAIMLIPGSHSGPVTVSTGTLNWPGEGAHTGMVCDPGDGLCIAGDGRCTQDLDKDKNGNGYPDAGDTISCYDNH